MRALRRRVCVATGTLLIVFGLALLLASCAPSTSSLPPAAPVVSAPSTATKVLAKPARPRPRAVARLPPARPAIAPAQRPAAAPQEGAVVTKAPLPAGPLVPLKAHRYAPVLAAKQHAIWPAAPEPHTLAGLVEQESCVSLKSPRCWDPHAELKTPREAGTATAS